MALAEATEGMSKDGLLTTSGETVVYKKLAAEDKEVPGLKEEDPMCRRLYGNNLNLWLWWNGKEEEAKDAGARLLALIDSAKQIERIDIGADLWIHLSAEEVTEVLQALGGLPQLKWLHFSLKPGDKRCSLSADTLTIMVSQAKHLQYLLLKDVRLEGTAADWKAFTEALKSHPFLIHLRLENCVFQRDPIDLQDLLTALSYINPFETIEIFATDGPVSKSHASHLPIPALACLIRDSKSLKVVRLCGLDIGDDHLSKMVEPLSESKTLKELLLWKTRITETGSASIAKALKVNSTLEQLNLNDNDAIGSRGCQILMEATAKSTHNLHELYVGCSHMDTECRESLIHLLASNKGGDGPSLRRLEICFSWPLECTVQSLAEFGRKVEKALQDPHQKLLSLRLYHDQVDEDSRDLRWGSKWRKRLLDANEQVDEDDGDDKAGNNEEKC